MCETVLSRMLLLYDNCKLVMFLVALQFSADTIMDFHQLSEYWLRCRRGKPIHFRLIDFRNHQYGCSGTQILLLMQDEILFTLNFMK